MDNIKIGSQIAMLRKQNGYTQEELAEKLNITAQAVSKWENGHTLPETSLLPLLSKLLNSSIDSILMPLGVREGNISFGNYEWRILHENENNMLIITETTIGKAPYHDYGVNTSWEHCSLRKYLNVEFYDKFSEAEKARIIKTKISDRDNPWYGVRCGNSTMDNVFLLSYDEVIKYFGDSGNMENRKAHYWAKNGIKPHKVTANAHSPHLCVHDEYNEARKVRDAKGAEDWWWLRSPGGQGQETTGSIGYVGEIWMCGDDAYRVDGGVRPAMWVKL
jgi:transcriptional regulator with XRE-family HTH domain